MNFQILVLAWRIAGVRDQLVFMFAMILVEMLLTSICLVGPTASLAKQLPPMTDEDSYVYTVFPSLQCLFAVAPAGAISRNDAWSMVMRGEGGELAKTTCVPIGGAKTCPVRDWHLHDFGDFDIWKRN